MGCIVLMMMYLEVVYEAKRERGRVAVSCSELKELQ